MEPEIPNHSKSNRPRSQSKFRNWLSRLFCMSQHKEVSLEQPMRNSERSSKLKQKQKIHLSLLGSYKSSTLCKISRKNFMVDSSQMANGRIPSAVSKYLGDKITSSTAVVIGDISTKVTRRIPCAIKVIAKDDKVSGECIYGDLKTLKTRVDQLCILRPKFPSQQTPQLLLRDEPISKEISTITNRFRNSIIILPKDTILDEIGLILANTAKFVEVETIVANGASICLFVYVGSKEFVLLSEAEQIEFVAKQLKKDLLKDDLNVSQFVQKIYQRSSIEELLSLLRKSIHQAYIDTIFSCFIRNAISRQLITHEEMVQLFPDRAQQAQVQHTPSLRLTARFNFATSQNFKHSCSNDMLNGENGELFFDNEIDTFAETQISLRGLQLMGEFKPYDSQQ